MEKVVVEERIVAGGLLGAGDGEMGFGEGDGGAGEAGGELDGAVELHVVAGPEFTIDPFEGVGSERNGAGMGAAEDGAADVGPVLPAVGEVGDDEGGGGRAKEEELVEVEVGEGGLRAEDEAEAGGESGVERELSADQRLEQGLVFGGEAVGFENDEAHGEQVGVSGGEEGIEMGGGEFVGVADEFVEFGAGCGGEGEFEAAGDRKSTRLNSSHTPVSRMPSSA